jgi:hypothetical protein
MESFFSCLTLHPSRKKDGPQDIGWSNWPLLVLRRVRTPENVIVTCGPCFILVPGTSPNLVNNNASQRRRCSSAPPVIVADGVERLLPGALNKLQQRRERIRSHSAAYPTAVSTTHPPDRGAGFRDAALDPDPVPISERANEPGVDNPYILLNRSSIHTRPLLESG